MTVMRDREAAGMPLEKLYVQVRLKFLDGFGDG